MYLGVLPAAAVLADQQKILPADHAVAPLAAGDLDLVAQIYIVVLQELCGLAAGQRVFQIHEEAVEQVQVADRQARNAQGVDLGNQVFLELLEAGLPAAPDLFGGDAVPAEGMPVRLAAAAAFCKAGALGAAVHAADGIHGDPSLNLARRRVTATDTARCCRS